MGSVSGSQMELTGKACLLFLDTHCRLNYNTELHIEVHTELHVVERTQHPLCSFGFQRSSLNE
jgi:hypothetical protein